MNSSGNLLIYNATPLEQAHSLYLAQQVFGIGLPLSNNNAVCISGRNAVAFLTQSGVDRSLLRSIWSVADPQNLGSLANIQQFRVILRLVAMAQAGLLQQQQSNLAMALSQYSLQQLNLPFFSNVVLPSPNELMQMYGHLVVIQQQQQQQKNNFDTFSQPSTPSRQQPNNTPSQQISTSNSSLQSVGDAFGNLVEVQDAPLTPLRDMSVPQYNAASSSANASTPLSLSDAFSGMGESTNAPLPALGQSTPSRNSAGTASINATNKSTMTPTTTKTPTPTRSPAQIALNTKTTTTTTTTTPGGGSATGGGTGFGFWSLGSSSVADRAKSIAASTPKNTAPAPMATSILATVSDDEDGEDGFGAFGSAPATAATATAFAAAPPPIPSMPINNSSSNDNPLGGASQRSPLDFYTPQPQRPFVTDSGPTLSDPIGMQNSNNAVAPTVSVSDAFGDMMPVVDAPLPSLDAFGSQEVKEETAIPQDGVDDAASKHNEDDDSDGFGNFEEAAGDNVDGENDDNDNDDGFGSFEAATAAVSVSAPLGALDSAPIGTDLIGFDGDKASEPGASLSITDAFGDMPVQEDIPLPSLGAFANAAAVSAPVLDDGLASSKDDDDDFGDFEDAPAPTTNTTLSEPEPLVEDASSESESDDDFGDFGGAPATTENQPDPVSLSITDAFGGMPTQPDAPLPSLGDFGLSHTAPVLDDGLASSKDDDDDDDFGDFEDAPAPTTNTTLSDPEALVEDASSESESGDDFGDFGGAPATTENQPNPVSLSITDAFGGMPTQPDAPLPSLGDFGLSHTDTVTDDASKDDGFGDFADAAPATWTEPEAKAPRQDDNDPDDDFGDFTNAAPAATGESGSNVVETLHARSVSIDDAFGDFAAAEDAPLPPLELLGGDTTSSTSPPAQANPGTSDEDFGDFSGTSQQNEPPVPVENDEDDDEDEFGDFDEADNVVGQQSNPMEERDQGGTESNAPTHSVLDDPFGDMPSNDAPLPSLEMLSAVPTRQSAEFNLPEAGENDSDDEFGGFETSAAMNSGTSQSFVPDDSNPTTVDAADTNPSSISDAFGDFEVADAPLPSLQNLPTSSSIEPEEGLFGHLVSNEAPHAQSSLNDDGGDLLDIFGSQAPVTTQPISTSSNSAEDDFGDFGSAQPEPEEANAARNSSKDDAFGDFGSAQIAPAVPQDDDFGDFGSAPVVQQSVPEDAFGHFENAENTTLSATNATNDDTDDFGDFGSAPVQQSAKEDDFGNFGTSEPVATADNTDDFGDFGSASVQQSAKEDDFGDFGTSEPVTTADNTDDFGDFGSAPVQQSAKEDDFGDFGSANLATAAQTEEEEGFGDFGSANLSSPIETTEAGKEEDFGDFGSPPIKEEDEFGDFGSADFSPPVQHNRGNIQSEAAEEFGDFTVVEAPNPSHPVNHGDNFGDFSSFQDSSAPTEGSQQAPKDDDGDDWGDFEAVSPPSHIETEEVRLRDRIRSLGLLLPDSVLRKSGVSGDHVDLGESFEVNVGTKSALTDATRKRAQRCIQVLESLTSSENSKLASMVWVQIFNVIIEELDQAKSVLEEATSSFSGQWSELITPLSVMVQGLAEYLRVTRSIVASIGDMLLLDESAMLTVDTWASTWCSMSVLEKALVCENKWKEIEHLLTKTPMDAVTPASLQEIRSEANATTSTKSTLLCHLTLQPLQRKQHKNTTKAEVSFQGKSFMACSANFLANRCPFFVVGEER